jgi:hypothetical protein
VSALTDAQKAIAACWARPCPCTAQAEPPAERTPVDRLIELARQHVAEEIPPREIEAAVLAIAREDLPDHVAWRLFEELADEVQLLDDVEDGRKDWRDVDPDLICGERGAAAADIMRGRVTYTAQRLLPPA